MKQPPRADADITKLLTVSLREERDIVTARQRAHQLARVLLFCHQDQVRIATAASEMVGTHSTMAAADGWNLAFACRAVRKC